MTNPRIDYSSRLPKASWEHVADLLTTARSTNSADLLYKGEDGGVIVRVSPGIVVKSVPRDVTEEAIATRFVKANTTIPVPQIIDINDITSRAISMTECQGVTLGSCIADMTMIDLEYIATQLHDFVVQMQSLPLPKTSSDGHLGSITGGPYNNMLFPEFAPVSCPWTSIKDFYSYWYDILTLSGPDSRPYATEVIQGLPSDSPSVFTHGDLAPRNIMVDPSQRTITAILDWELTGWYPKYWEYCRMRDAGTSIPNSWNSKWDMVVHRVFQREDSQFRVYSRLMTALRGCMAW